MHICTSTLCLSRSLKVWVVRKPSTGRKLQYQPIRLCHRKSEKVQKCCTIFTRPPSPLPVLKGVWVRDYEAWTIDEARTIDEAWTIDKPHPLNVKHLTMKHIVTLPFTLGHFINGPLQWSLYSNDTTLTKGADSQNYLLHKSLWSIVRCTSHNSYTVQLECFISTESVSVAFFSWFQHYTLLWEMLARH